MSVSAYGELVTSHFHDVLADSAGEVDLSGGASVALYAASIDNSQNKDPVYLKLYNATGPTFGTTAPDWIIKCAAGEKRVQSFGSRASGRTFATGLSYCVVAEPGTAGTTSPTNPVGVHLATN